jgi:hypothetical protein
MVEHSLNNTIEMSKYYNGRKAIRTLYNHDTYKNGDLYCSVLEVRDRHRCVNSISIDTVAYAIYVDLEDNTSDSMKSTIIGQLANAIKDYIVKNINELEDKSKSDVNMILSTSGIAFCDISVVGNSIRIIL